MEAKYDFIAQWYNDLVENDDFTGQILSSHLWELIDDVDGKHVCDLACGQGRIARQLADRKALVTGVDLSTELIEIARRKEDNHRIHYVVDNAETLSTITDNQFDLVVCNLALMDILDINKVFASVRRILKSDGKFIFSITHPCFESPQAEWIKTQDSIARLVHAYGDEGLWYSTNKNGVRGQVGAHHRTLSTYINGLSHNEFTIERMIEPLMPQNTVKPTIGHQVIPAFMLMKCHLT
ncbi:MAG: class I SAM-dependent methyltransferase [Chloroflexota bacterium]